MDKILIIITGESFRGGGANNRSRGNNEKYNEQQKIACQSHLRLFDFIKKEHSLDSEIFINSYEALGHEKKLLTWYGDKVIYYNFHTQNFPNERLFIDDTIIRLRTIDLNQYKYCLFIRPDYYIKKYFLEKLKFDNKVRYAFVDSNPIIEDYLSLFSHFKCISHNITLVPKFFFNLLLEKKVWNWHSSASELTKALNLSSQDNIEDYIDLFIDTLHWSSTDLEWNPLFGQCGRFNNITYNQCYQLQELTPVANWIYASNGLFYDKKTKKKYLVENCTFYDELRKNELLENPDLDKFL
jgi:hypothetical protein